MKPVLTMLSLAALLACSHIAAQQSTTMPDQKDQAASSTAPADTTPKVTGIGGIFFFSDDPKKAQEWYAKNLGIETNDWGSSSFESRDLNNPDSINSLQWKPFKKADAYFAPSKREPLRTDFAGDFHLSCSPSRFFIS